MCFYPYPNNQAEAQQSSYAVPRLLHSNEPYEHHASVLLSNVIIVTTRQYPLGTLCCILHVYNQAAFKILCLKTATLSIHGH